MTRMIHTRFPISELSDLLDPDGEIRMMRIPRIYAKSRSCFDLMMRTPSPAAICRDPDRAHNVARTLSLFTYESHLELSLVTEGH